MKIVDQEITSWKTTKQEVTSRAKEINIQDRNNKHALQAKKETEEDWTTVSRGKTSNKRKANWILGLGDQLGSPDQESVCTGRANLKLGSSPAWAASWLQSRRMGQG